MSLRAIKAETTRRSSSLRSSILREAKRAQDSCGRMSARSVAGEAVSRVRYSTLLAPGIPAPIYWARGLGGHADHDACGLLHRVFIRREVALCEWIDQGSTEGRKVIHITSYHRQPANQSGSGNQRVFKMVIRASVH
jgi:hypothetical protein